MSGAGSGVLELISGYLGGGGLYQYFIIIIRLRRMWKAKGASSCDKPTGAISHYLVTWLTNLTIRITEFSQCGFCTGFL